MMMTMKQKKAARSRVEANEDKEGWKAAESCRTCVREDVVDDDDETKEGGGMEVRSVAVRARTCRRKQTRTRKDGRRGESGVTERERERGREGESGAIRTW